MTKPTPRDIEKIIAADRRIIRALADIAEAKLSPPPQRLAMRNNSSTKTTPTPAPKKSPTEKSEAMKISKPTRRTAPKHRAPVTPKAKPGVKIEIAPDALVPSASRSPLSVSRAPRVQESAQYLGEGETSPCFVCGGECGSTEPQWGPWRRHEECLKITQAWERIAAAAVSLGIDVSNDEAVAVQATFYVCDYADEHASNVYDQNDRDRSPWSHVDRKALDRAIVTARQALAATEEAGPCELGSCAWCGVEESIEWSDYGHARQDGTRAPLCSTCGPIFDKLPGLPMDRWADQRPGISEAVTGVSPDIMERVPVALKAHAEIGGGDGTPWSHLPVEAVEAYRWEVWGRYGGTHAPEEHRAEAVARAEAHEADRDARRVATETADPYGFSSVAVDEGSRDG